MTRRALVARPSREQVEVVARVVPDLGPRGERGLGRGVRRRRARVELAQRQVQQVVVQRLDASVADLRQQRLVELGRFLRRRPDDAVPAVVFFFAETLASLLPILIGALFLFGGIIRLIQALGYRQSMAGRWLWFLIGSLLWIGVGILMLTNPFSSLLVLFQLFGGILIAIAILELFLYFTIRSTKRQARY